MSVFIYLFPHLYIYFRTYLLQRLCWLEFRYCCAQYNFQYHKHYQHCAEFSFHICEINKKGMQSVTVLLNLVLDCGVLLAEYHSKIRKKMEQSCIYL
jgi:hypothetical protein